MKAYWHFRTALMFAFLSLLFAAVGWAVGWYFGSPIYGMLALLLVAVIILTYSAIFSKSMALRANRVRLVTQAEEPRLYGIVKSVADKAGIPMPDVGITEDFMPNAFATGRGPKDSAVVATRGLLYALNDEELEGVIAHEVSHIKNRDILVMSVASAAASIITFVARYGVFFAAFGGNRNDKNQGMMVLIAILAYITLPLAALLVQLSISRKREFLADQTGAEITGKPEALASALRSIERGCSSPKNDYNNPAYSSVWISNPFGTRKSLTRNIFSTHPSTEERIELLMKMAAENRNSEPKRPVYANEGYNGTSEPFWNK